MSRTSSFSKHQAKDYDTRWIGYTFSPQIVICELVLGVRGASPARFALIKFNIAIGLNLNTAQKIKSSKSGQNSSASLRST
jgi:hypothetical protein